MTIGIDVLKDILAAFSHPDGKRRRCNNAPAGYEELMEWIDGAQGDIVRIVFETKDPYHRALERALTKVSLPAVKVNPQQALNNPS